MMTIPSASFLGSIPENYDRFLGPVFFHHYADDLVGRVFVTAGMRILEIACGTGIVTERLVRRVVGEGSIVATDLNEAMFDYARRRGVNAPELQWREADATELPFEDASFDAVVCQFGLMFLSDKVAGVREAFRILKPGGQYLFNVWDSMDRNPIARITHEVVTSFFPDNPPQFYLVPFSLCDPAPIRAWLHDVGFCEIKCETVAKMGSSPSAEDAATGLIEGTPVCTEIINRRSDAMGEIKAAVARKIAGELGERPVRCPESAHVFTARKA
jgi:SAM-dependent methyltransferase